MKVSPSFWLSLLFVVVIGVAVVTAMQWSWDTRLFPWAIGIPTMALALWQLVSDLLGTGAAIEEGEAPPSRAMDIPVDRSIPPEVMRRRTIRALGWVMAFALGIWLLGFLVAIPLFVFFYLIREAQAGVPGAALITGLIFLFIWGLFDFIMHLSWPEPLIFRILGY